MKPTNLLQLSLIFMLLIPGTIMAQGITCFSGLEISLAYSDAESAAICQDDGNSDVLRFSASLLVQPVGYVVVDENDIIVKSTYSNIIDLEGLPTGNLRVYGFYYIGKVNDTVGQNLNEANLATGCFNLSDNFFPIFSIIPAGQTISTVDGESSVYTCPGDGNADVVSFATSSTDPFYTYVITDDNNIILGFADGNSHDFDGAPEGTCRVWGVSSIGEINTDAVGEDIESVVFSEDCFDLSDNYVEIIRSVPEGGGLILADGTDSIVLCANDETPDLLTFAATTASLAPYTFFLTDVNNEIQQQLEGNTLDPTILANGVSRVWGVSFTGEVTFSSEDDITVVDLSNDCFDLSDNYVEITKKDLDGGTVSLSDGTSSTLVCVNDGEAVPLTFTNTSSSSDSYVYLIINTSGVIEEVVDGDTFGFDASSPDTSYVQGVSYSGNLLAQAGDPIATTVLSDECYEISTTVVTVVKKAVEGAAVSLVDGSAEITICVQDGVDDILEMTNTSEASESYAYIITDDADNILNYSDSPSINLEGADSGVCKIWGLSYSGSLMITLGETVTTALLSNECYDLSDNVVTVTRKSTEGGSVTLEDGATEIFVCVGDGNPDILSFTSTGNQGDNFIFVITDDQDNILNFSLSGVVNFENAEAGVCRVRGLSYTGNLTGAVGDNALSTVMSDECFDLSDDFVTIDRRGLNGGTVSLVGGGTEATVCLDDIAPDMLSFETTSTDLGDYVFVITDENNVILDLSETGEVDFSGADPGICHVWGLSYTGNITAQAGDDASTVALSDQCYDLSDNFVTISRKDIEGGSISLESGATEKLVCSNDEVSGLLVFNTTSTASSEYGYAITDTTNKVLILLNGNSIDFTVADPGTYLVWGFSYTGNTLIDTDSDAGQDPISDECYDLSDNFVTIRLENVDGGTVAMPSGETSRYTCPGDGVSDIVEFTNTTSSDGGYVYVITDLDNIILAINETGSADFEGAGVGTCLVWGLAYTGELTAQVGDDASAVALSDACFDLSDNAITLFREEPNGGMVSMPSGDTVHYACPGDDMEDIVLFDSTGTSNTPYGYIITDEENVILAFAEGDQFDFNDAPIGVCRVWGLAYIGNLTAFVGDDADDVALASECYDLSDNFIEIRRVAPAGGIISFADGSESIALCAGDEGSSVVQMTAQDASPSPYVFVILEESDDDLPLIVGMTQSDTFDFATLEEKNYIIRGLAYTGNLQIAVGEELDDTAALSDDCFSLSDNVLSVNTVQPDGGTISVEGFDTNDINICVGDGTPDSLVFVVNTSAAAASSTKIITDGNGIFLTTLDEDVFDLENSAGGIFLVYHVSYTGNIALSPGDDIDSVAVSSGCAELSEPAVINAQLVDGGRLLTTSNDTLLYICANDGIGDTVTVFNTSSALDASYKYLLVTDGIILSAQDTNVFALTDTRFEAIELWGVSYTGTFNPSVGESVGDAVLSDGCFILSDNPVQLFIDEEEGGSISAEGGATELSLCIGADESLVQLETTSSSSLGYVYVLTTEDDTIIRVIDGDSVDFAELPVGSYHIWAVSYAGTLTVTPTADFLNTELATGCFDRSANFIEVIRFPAVSGGRIFAPGNDDVIYSCPGNGVSDIVNLFNTGNAPNDEYSYLITTGDGKVFIPNFTGDVIDFDPAPAMTYRIYGISYHGDLLTQFGTDIFTDMLADSCFELSENFIEVINQLPEAGAITTEAGETMIDVVQGDEIADSVTFVNSGASDQRYAYVVTDEDNVIVAMNEDGIFDFEVLGSQPLRVWGLSYTGNITAQVGDDADDVAITDDCSDLTDEFVTVNVSQPGTQHAQEWNRFDTNITLNRILAVPNPVHNWVNLRIEILEPNQSESVIHIFNTSGQLVYQGRLAHTDGLHNLELNTSNWRSGIYAVRVQNGDKVVTDRFVKQE